MAVDLLDRLVVADADMVWLDAHDRAELLVKLMDGRVSVPPPANAHKPEIRELGGKWRRDAAQLSIGHEVVVHVRHHHAKDQGKGRPWREDEAENRHCRIRRCGTGRVLQVAGLYSSEVQGRPGDLGL